MLEKLSPLFWTNDIISESEYVISNTKLHQYTKFHKAILLQYKSVSG